MMVVPVSPSPWIGRLVAGALLLAPAIASAAAPAPLAPLPDAAPGNPATIELGKHLFFDSRLAGDWGVSCASCHAPEKGWGDDKPLADGYPGTLYFRNAPGLVNARFRNKLMWDGRLDGADMGTLVRDQITEAVFMNADGRLVQERLKQIPGYVELWTRAFGAGSDPYGPAMFNAIGEFVKSLRSQNVPFDRYLNGDAQAIDAAAKRGYALFTDKAGCIRCHHGPLASDGRAHRTGVPENPDVLASPERSIAMLRHYASSGMPNYMHERSDVGLFAITKHPDDRGKFLTPTLRELEHTAPYMHNGVFDTLDAVIRFYNAGGGPGSGLQPLQLDAHEQADLKAFLLTLSGDPLLIEPPELPELDVRDFGKN